VIKVRNWISILLLVTALLLTVKSPGILHDLSSLYQNDIFLGIDDKTANDMRHTLCSGKRILKNHAIHGGLKAGNFTEISAIDSIENCTVLCCREQRCEMAMMLNGVCFVGNCRNKEKCKPVKLASKAGMVSHLGFKIPLEDETLQGINF
jgi:hypothetical protein